MSGHNSISDAYIQDLITSAVNNVCSTMVRKEATFIRRLEARDFRVSAQEAHFFGCVGFRGQINGLVHLCIPDNFAQHAASVILGMKPDEMMMQGEDMVGDVIGEITNMTVGNFKNALCDMGYSCKLTIPRVVRGINPNMEILQSSRRHIFHFDCHKESLVADIQLVGG
jgi:chemotaxis protein CheX